MSITTRLKIAGGAYLQDHLLTSHARVPALHLGKHPVGDYFNTFNKFTTILGEDIPIEDITHTELEAFFPA